MPRDYVLDAFALLAYLDAEEGADIVTGLISQAPQESRLFVSIVNLGEVAYNAEREHGAETAREKIGKIRQLPIEYAGVDEQRVLAAAHIKANYRVSYADAFAIALAQQLDATIVTGDPEFKNVEKSVEILWLAEPKRKAMRERRAGYRVKRERVRHK